MTVYPFGSIEINGREVTIETIVSGTASAKTDFEHHTFSFIEKWFTQVEDFSIPTSGSTGDPKTIAITRAQMVASARMTLAALNITPNKGSALVCLSTRLIAGRMMLVRAFESGMRIIAVEPSANPCETISACDIQLAAFVPLQLQTILYTGKKIPTILTTIKAILVGGAAINDVLQREITRTNVVVYATYGMTETISHIALQKLDTNDAHSVYTTLPGIQIAIDVRGCLVVQVPYLKDTVVTNDLVEIISETKFKWLGRWDTIINTGGIKVSPETIESRIRNVLFESGIDQNYFVSSLPDQKLGNKVVLVLEGNNIVEKENLLRRLKQLFTKYEAPKEVYSIPRFIYTESNKINRKETIKQLSRQ
jgi:O-succinylbenzoic acid--CoA ligase